MTDHAKQTVLLKGSLYDFLRKAAQIGLPATGTLYFALAQIWDLPKAEEVVGTIAAVNVFVGTLVGISKSQYNKSDEKYAGVINVIDDPTAASKVYSLDLHSDPADLDKQNQVIFKVDTQK